MEFNYIIEKIKKVFLTSDMNKEENGHSKTGNTDVIVQFENGSKYIASFLAMTILIISVTKM